jgi:hypothetical protein
VGEGKTKGKTMNTLPLTTINSMLDERRAAAATYRRVKASKKARPRRHFNTSRTKLSPALD